MCADFVPNVCRRRSGELVGHDRRVPAGRCVLATWNVWGGNAPGVYTRERGIARGAVPRSLASQDSDPERTWRHRAPLLAAELARASPDVVALQESTRLRGGTTCASDIATRLEMHLIEDDHPRGLALLSRCRIRPTPALRIKAEMFAYPAPLVAEVEVNCLPLTCVVLHLPPARSGDRAPLVRELATSFDSLSGSLAVLGDLNSPPDDPVMKSVRAIGLEDVSALAGPTVPNPGPVVRLDYVLLRADAVVRSAAMLGHDVEKRGYCRRIISVSRSSSSFEGATTGGCARRAKVRDDRSTSMQGTRRRSSDIRC